MKKIVSLLLCFVLVFSLAACGGKKEAPKSETESKATTTEKESSAEESGEPTGLTYNGQDVSEEVELIMYYIGDPAEDETLVVEEINKILKEEINATIVPKSMSLSDYATKYALTIAGGEKLDLIYTSAWAFYQAEASKGAFAEVTQEVLENYLPGHKEGQAEASFGQAKIAGKVYFIPNNIAAVNANAIVIRGDLREKYGLDKLESIDDLEQYYEAIANDSDSSVNFPYDASQNNDTAKLIYFHAKNNLVQIGGSIQNYFTYEYTAEPKAEDTFWIYSSPEYLEYANRMKEWADKGFWSKSAIANATDVKEAFMNGTSASYIQNLGTVGATASQVEESHPEWKVEVCDPTPDADRFLGAYTGDGFAVLAGSSHQDRAFMALDVLKFNEECYDLVRHGIEGKHYTLTPENTWEPAEDFSKYPFGAAISWGLKNSVYEKGRAGTFPDQKEIADKWTAREIESPTAAFSFDEAAVQNELANLQSVYTQYIPLLDLGLIDDVEGTLAEFQKQAETAGLEKIEEEFKSQIDTFLTEGN